MFDELDEVLRQLLVKELPIKKGEVDIAFQKPNREWSGRLSRPTLNLYLYDVRENIKLRQQSFGVDMQRANGRATQRRRPFRVDARYVITAWATEPEDEHRLLARTMMALFRNPELPIDSLPEVFRDQPAPISLQTAQLEDFQNPADFWGAMDNDWKPGIACVATLALNPYQEITGPLVITTEIRIGQSARPARNTLLPDTEERSTGIGGVLRSATPLQDARLRVIERGISVRVQADGKFIIFGLENGDYTLELSAGGRAASRHRLTVPSSSYEISV